MDDFVRWLVADAPRRGQSFLHSIEQRRIESIVDDLPESISPAHLSLLGAAGAVVAAAALVGSNSWLWLVLFAPVGMAINWFGLSVDLPLARRRKEDLPRANLSHHVAELFSHLLVVAAYGFSPFLTLRAASVILVCYLLFSSYTYIRAATRHVEQMAYIGIGVTEFRLLLAFWPFLALAFGVPESVGDRLPVIDIAVIAMAFCAIVGLVTKLFVDSRKIAATAPREE